MKAESRSSKVKGLQKNDKTQTMFEMDPRVAFLFLLIFIYYMVIWRHSTQEFLGGPMLLS